MTKAVLSVKVELPMKFASGNQLGQQGSRRFRPKEYHDYKDYVVKQVQDVIDEIGNPLEFGKAYLIRELYLYPVPKSLVSTKKKRAEFEAGTLHPTTRGTIDLDNSSKATNDALQEVLGIDDSQFVNLYLSKRYWDRETYGLAFEVFELEDTQEWEFYE